MKNPENNDRLLDQYLLNLLSKEETTRFENQMAQDPDLRAEVGSRSELIKGIETFNRKALKQQLQNIHQQMEAPPLALRRRLFPRIAAAASIAALVFAGYWFFRPNPPTDPYVAYFQVQELNLAQRDKTNPQLLQLEQWYENQNYEAALPLFANLLKDSPNNSQLLLGAGISCLQLNQTDQALNYFNACLENDDFRYQDHATWYTALTYLKKGNQSKAKAFLTRLAKKEQADHQKEAQQLLLELKQ